MSDGVIARSNPHTIRPKRQRVLLLGGNRYNLAGIRAAREAGFFVLVADRNPEAPGLRAADVGLPIDLHDDSALLSAIEAQGGINGILSMAEAGVRTAARLARRLGLPGIPEEAAANATSKARMRACWSAIGEYSVPFRVINTIGQARIAAREIGYPLILKPDRSFGGSRGVSRVDSEDQLAAAHEFAVRHALADRTVVVEPFITGVEHSAETLIWEGQVSVLCVGRKIKSAYPYRVDLSVQYPAPLTEQEHAHVARMCEQAVHTLGLNRGIAHIEFSYTETGPVLLELGARCGGGHTPQIAHHVSDVNEFIEACRMACGLQPVNLRPKQRRGADYRFLVFPPGRLADVEIPECVRRHDGIMDVDVTVAPHARITPLQTTSDRAGFVPTVADDLQEAARLADWACRQITVRYQGGRCAPAMTLDALRASSEQLAR